jgi:AmmeMemoRadiSam system protein B
MRGAVIRDPAVAGTFYPAQPDALRAQLQGFLAGSPRKARPVRLLLGPHAGYLYSGAIAGEGYRLVELPSLVVILAPNHYGVGAPLALPRSGTWRTPLGDLPIDEQATAAIAARHAGFGDDWRAHARDHALEVHLPFLQELAARQGTGFGVVTLSVGTHDLGELLAAGRAVACGLRDCGRESASETLIVVSSDMSHYIPAEEARRRDLPALERVLAGDPEGLHAEVLGQGVSMCGVAPAVVGLEAARRLGTGAGELVRYGHSGEVTGDSSEVVAYASVILAPAA